MRALMAFAAGAALGFVGAMLAPAGKQRDGAEPAAPDFAGSGEDSLEAFQTSLKHPETHVPSRKPRREPQKAG